jgi:chromosome segregation ATPase
MWRPKRNRSVQQRLAAIERELHLITEDKPGPEGQTHTQLHRAIKDLQEHLHATRMEFAAHKESVDGRLDALEAAVRSLDERLTLLERLIS